MLEEGNVVEEFYIDNAHIKICDDYCRNKTKAEVDEILKRIARLTIGPLLAAEENKTKEPKKE